MPRKKPAKLTTSACAAQRRSRRRDAVLAAVTAAGSHLSAEQVHRAAARLLPGLGLATVYRALKRLCACGELSEFIPSDGVARYEAAGPRPHHDHLICTACGAFIEAVDPEIERLQQRLAARHGFTATSHRLELYGLCRGCAGK